MMVNKVCLLLLISTTLVAQDLLQLRLIGSPEKSANEFVGADITDANDRICAAVQVVSDMEGFSYQANNGVVRLDDGPGKDMVFLQPDEMVLEILHSGYQPLKLVLNEIGIHLSSREVWVIKIFGDKKLIELPIAIISRPEGAEVFIDGQSRGAGEQLKITPGRHELRLHKAQFHPFIATIVVDENHTLFKYDLVRQQDVNFQIDSDPPGATVYLDGVKLPGTTLLSAFYPAGRYKIKIEKEWYLPLEDSISIQEGMKNKSFKLLPDFATLSVASAPQTGLEIFLNGRSQNVQTPYTFQQLTPGSYRVRARSKLYETEDVEVQVARGEKKSLSLNSTATFAVLTIQTLPGATVTLNGQAIQQLKNMQIEPSVVMVRAELKKARPAEQRLVLKRGEVQTVELSPQLLQGTIEVAVTPIAAQVELTGDAGESFSSQGAKIFENIPVGSYNLKVSCSGYAPKQETLVLNEGEKINKSITLEKTAVTNSLSGTSQDRVSEELSNSYIEMGNSFMRAKQWDKAAEMYEKKFQSDPTHVTSYINYALCKQQLKDFIPAYHALAKALKMRPNYSMGHYYLAVVLSQMDSVNSARNEFRVFLTLADAEREKYKNEFKRAYRYSAIAYLQEKNYSNAVPSLEKYTELDPHDAEMWLFLAQTYFAVNRRDDAKRAFLRVQQLDPNNKDAQKGLDILDLYN